MKLDNKGWGTMEMLLISGGLLLALLVSVFFISKLYGNFDNAVSNKNFIDLETKIENAARKYINSNNITDPYNYRLSLNELQNGGFIDNLQDSNGNFCDGYVIVNTISGVSYYDGFISCQDYRTTNY